jgi:multiple sugar transport system substrate-binding protein
LAARGVDVSRFSQGPLDICRLDGKLYCVGSYLGTILLLYNKNAFDAAGIPYPSATVPMSLDEYAAIAAKLTKKDADLSKRVWGGEVSATYWWMDPRTIVSEDARTVTGYVDDEATIHAWDVMGKMARDGSGLTGADLDAAGTDEADFLATGRVAMAFGGNDALQKLEEQKFAVGVAPVPVEKPGDPVWVPTWTDSWGVTAKSAHLAEAQELIVWIATEGNKVRAANGTLPLDLKTAEDSGWIGGVPEHEALVALGTAATPPVFVPSLFGDLSDSLETAFSKLIETGDAAGTLHEIAPIMQDDLDKNWQQWDAIQ